MKVLLVSDRGRGERELEERLIRSLELRSCGCKRYDVKDAELKKCVGCFNCWIRTPGVCVFDDLSREICRDDVDSDVYVLLSEVKYGGFSPEIKRVLDRSIGLLLPFFKLVGGEMHHAPRYEKYPDLIFVGYGDDLSAGEEATFRGLTQSVALNFQKESAPTFLCRDEKEIEDLLPRILREIEQKEADLS